MIRGRSRSTGHTWQFKTTAPVCDASTGSFGNEALERLGELLLDHVPKHDDESNDGCMLVVPELDGFLPPMVSAPVLVASSGLPERRKKQKVVGLILRESVGHG